MISEVHFVNSKSIQMVQAADIYAGVAAEFVEANMEERAFQCLTCGPALHKARRQRTCATRKVRKRVAKVELLDIMYPLLVRNYRGFAVPDGFFILPNDRRWYFVDCAGGT